VTTAAVPLPLRARLVRRSPLPGFPLLPGAVAAAAMPGVAVTVTGAAAAGATAAGSAVIVLLPPRWPVLGPEPPASPPLPGCPPCRCLGPLPLGPPLVPRSPFPSLLLPPPLPGAPVRSSRCHRRHRRIPSVGRTGLPAARAQPPPLPVPPLMALGPQPPVSAGSNGRAEVRPKPP
jgi:hypothetical protein